MSEKSRAAKLQDLQREHRNELADPSISAERHAEVSREIAGMEQRLAPAENPFASLKEDTQQKDPSPFEYDPSADIARGPKRY